MNDFTESKEYKIGDTITADFALSWFRVMCKRVRMRKWNVPKKASITFVCIDTSAGAMWPEVKSK